MLRKWWIRMDNRKQAGFLLNCQCPAKCKLPCDASRDLNEDLKLKNANPCRRVLAASKTDPALLKRSCQRPRLMTSLALCTNIVLICSLQYWIVCIASLSLRSALLWKFWISGLQVTMTCVPWASNPCQSDPLTASTNIEYLYTGGLFSHMGTLHSLSVNSEDSMHIFIRGPARPYLVSSPSIRHCRKLGSGADC